MYTYILYLLVLYSVGDKYFSPYRHAFLHFYHTFLNFKLAAIADKFLVQCWKLVYRLSENCFVLQF